ncbi:MAG: hypothetical protein ACRDVP_08700 [Acidimicrobiales bacterium]
MTAGRRRDHGAISKWSARILVLAGVLCACSILAGCSALHENLGTSDAPCYVALPTANKAVQRAGHLDGVKLFRVDSVPSHLRDRIRARLHPGAARVCLVAFMGHFSPDEVSLPAGRTEGTFAVVVLSYPSGKLIETLLFRRPPLRFLHSHLG